MRRFCLPLLALLCCTAAGATPTVDNSSWQTQFAGAPSWSTYGVTDDSGTTDNTSALNSIPGNTPVIADCPHSGFVQFTGTWSWPSGLKVWQKPGCFLKSTITTPGVFPIINTGGFTASSPITNVEYYGMNFSFTTPTSTVRVLEAWIDHFKFKYFDINGSGGFAFLRGSDQEVAYGTMENTQTPAGNPGIRHFGNIPKVAPSAGMRANDWFHDLNFLTGDATFQACQPGTNSLTWGYNVSTDDLLYEDAYGNSVSSAVMLVNLPQTTVGPDYTCTNIRFNNISGTGLWAGSIGNSNRLTQSVSVSNVTFTVATANTVPTLGIGAVAYGGVAATAPNTSNVSLSNITLSNVFQDAFAVVGTSNVPVKNLTISAPTVGAGSTGFTAYTDAATLVTISGSAIAAGNNAAAIKDGIGATASTGTTINSTTVTGVTNTKAGVSLANSTGATVTGTTVTKASGSTTAIGINLTTNPNGANNATVTGNTVTGLGTPVVCATGQGNVVTGNTGASDCAP